VDTLWRTAHERRRPGSLFRRIALSAVSYFLQTVRVALAPTYPHSTRLGAPRLLACNATALLPMISNRLTLSSPRHLRGVAKNLSLSERSIEMVSIDHR